MKIFKDKWKKFLTFLVFSNFTVVASCASFMSETKSAILDWMQGFLNPSTPSWVLEVILLIVINIVIIVFWIASQLFIVWVSNGTMRIAVGDDSNGKRIGEFQYFRAQAKKNVLIMGIGLSEVSKDTNSIEECLQNGKDITFLLMDPDVLVAYPTTSTDNKTVEPLQDYQSNLQEQFQNTKITIDDKKFSEFYLTDNYRENIKTSIGNLQNLVKRQDKRHEECTGEWTEGQIRVFKYSYYVPINVTISDMKVKELHSRLIVEFCLPFSTRRIRARFSRGKVKELIENQVYELLQKSELICKSAEFDSF